MSRIYYYKCALWSASFSAPDPKGPSGKKVTVESIIKEAMRIMRNAANKVWTRVKDISFTFTGKIKLGLVEIAVTPKIIPQALGPVFFCTYR